MSSKTPPFVPIWEKYAITVQEASKYFTIGENKLYQIVRENADADYLIWIGSKALIKRKRFEEHLDKMNTV